MHLGHSRHGSVSVSCPEKWGELPGEEWWGSQQTTYIQRNKFKLPSSTRLGANWINLASGEYGVETPPPGRSWGPGDLWPCPLSWGGVCARGGTQRAAMGPQCRASSVPVRSEAWNWSNGITPRILCSQPVTHATNSRTGRDCQPGTAEATSLPHPTAHLLRTGSSGQRRGPASGPRALWQPFTGEARPPTWV